MIHQSGHSPSCFKLNNSTFTMMNKQCFLLRAKTQNRETATNAERRLLTSSTQDWKEIKSLLKSRMTPMMNFTSCHHDRNHHMANGKITFDQQPISLRYAFDARPIFIPSYSASIHPSLLIYISFHLHTSISSEFLLLLFLHLKDTSFHGIHG